MKIINLDIKPLNISLKESFSYATMTLYTLPYCLVTITTDENIIGIGEVSTAWDVTGETQYGAIDMINFVKPLIENQTLDRLEDLEQIVASIKRNIAENSALKCGLEMALLDVLGKYLMVPVWKLLGGNYLEKIFMQKTLSFEEQNSTAYIASIKTALDQGVKTIKLKIGKDTRKELQVIKNIKNAFAHSQIIVDVNQGWNSLNQAMTFIKGLDRENSILCIEQPFHSDDYDAFIDLRTRTSIPIMADESCHNLLDLQNLFSRKAIDYVNIKIAKTGGILEAVKMIEFCETQSVKYMLGDMIQSSIGTAANLHLATMGNFISYDLTRPERFKEDVANGLQFNGYTVSIPTTTGLGITLI